MASSVLSAPRFQNEAAAFAYVEAQLWPEGPVCPHCGETARVGRLNGKTTRPGLCKCYACKKPFTVRMGTIFESSHLPLHLWLQIIHLFCASKKGISTRQIQRMLQCSMKTAWFLGHRIREAMKDGDPTLFGSNGGGVEADETYISRKEGREVKVGWGHKRTVLSLIDRETGRARSHVITDFRIATIAPVLEANVSRNARLITDEAQNYKSLGWNFADHVSVNHSRGEYVNRQDPSITTNTVEGYLSIFKRGMVGIYQHCAEKHLGRYVTEFDFRYSNRIRLGIDDVQRAANLVRSAKGKRLTYETIGSGRAA